MYPNNNVQKNDINTESVNKYASMADTEVLIENIVWTVYSHLSNKREVKLTDFEKLHPPQKKSTLHVYWFLRCFPPSTPRLLELCTSFFQKIPPRLLQHPRLVILQFFYPLHVYSNIREMRVSDVVKSRNKRYWNHDVWYQCMNKGGLISEIFLH